MGLFSQLNCARACERPGGGACCDRYLGAAVFTTAPRVQGMQVAANAEIKDTEVSR